MGEEEGGGEGGGRIGGWRGGVCACVDLKRVLLSVGRLNRDTHN